MPIVFADNTGCIQVAKDPVVHSKLKHIDTKYHLLCNHVQEGDIAMQYIKTDNSIADFLTMPVSQHLLACTRHINAYLAHSGVYHVSWIECRDTGIGIPVNR